MSPPLIVKEPAVTCVKVSKSSNTNAVYVDIMRAENLRNTPLEHMASNIANDGGSYRRLSVAPFEEVGRWGPNSTASPRRRRD